MKRTMPWVGLAWLAAIGFFLVQNRQLGRKLADLELELGKRSAAPERPAPIAPVAPDEVERLREGLTLANARIADLERRLNVLIPAMAEAGQGHGQTSMPFTSAQPPGTAAPPQNRRSWGPEQAAGPPDTHQAGDLSTAWAPREPDGGMEWLKLDYEQPVDIAQIRVRETYNPGAIAKIAALLDNGAEMVLWEGVEPTIEAPVEMEFNSVAGIRARSIRLYLDTTRTAGWNEIDAVELVARDGSRQWARSASASSTYAEP